jgi:hypothetical protein
VRVVIVTGTDTAATWKRLGAREFIRKDTTDLVWGTKTRTAH